MSTKTSTWTGLRALTQWGRREPCVLVGHGQARNNQEMALRALPTPTRPVGGFDATYFLRLWVTGIKSPRRAMRALPDRRGPRVGAAAVLTRFVATDLIETLPQALMGREPFFPTKLPIAPGNHYRAQAVFLPVFGLAQWLLMGGLAHGLLRLSGQRSEISRVLDVIGLGMLIPMPALWVGDTWMLATNRYRLPGLAVSHSAVQLWETAVFSTGLHAAQGVPWRPAVLAGATASAVYVLGGAKLVR